MEPVGPNLLIQLDPKLRLFDEISVSDSDISILSDPFQNGKEDAAVPHRKDLNGKDVLSAFGFSSILQDIMVQDKESRQNLSTMLAETPDQIRARTVFTQIRKKVPLLVQIKVGALLNDKAIMFGVEAKETTFVPDEKKTWEDIKEEILKSRAMVRNIRKLTEREKSRKQLMAQQENEAYETMSGYWRLLSVYDDFQLSPPGYNAYTGPEPHWLETQMIPRETVEESRNKVISWLEKYFKKY